MVPRVQRKERSQCRTNDWEPVCETPGLNNPQKLGCPDLVLDTIRHVETRLETLKKVRGSDGTRRGYCRVTIIVPTCRVVSKHKQKVLRRGCKNLDSKGHCSFLEVREKHVPLNLFENLEPGGRALYAQPPCPPQVACYST
jgi:hypothetical protein